mmetsp:Transcript_20775/g.52769  ORF Transcript_20775/g.52769 Transcript_20775/m.52769 type:complete len:198 (-) Transcript_20775:3768-4361(-)
MQLHGARQCRPGTIAAAWGSSAQLLLTALTAAPPATQPRDTASSLSSTRAHIHALCVLAGASIESLQAVPAAQGRSFVKHALSLVINPSEALGVAGEEEDADGSKQGEPGTARRSSGPGSDSGAAGQSTATAGSNDSPAEQGGADGQQPAPLPAPSDPSLAQIRAASKAPANEPTVAVAAKPAAAQQPKTAKEQLML